MKFTEKYPDAVNPTKRFPEKMLGPHPEVIVGPGLAQTWRMYPCASCKVITGFRLELGDDFPMVPCCSDECAADLRLPFVPDAATVEIPQAEGPALWPEQPSSLRELADEGFDEMFLTSNLVEPRSFSRSEENSTEGVDTPTVN